MSIKIYVKYVKNNRDFYTTKMNLPTGNLDQNTSYEIMEYFRNLNKKYGKTIIMITHDMNLAQNADEIIQIVDGRII